MSRLPAVAGSFYPGERKHLEATVKGLLDSCNPPKIHNALGIVSPHAGYIYSGSVAAETIKSVDIPETVILLGPNHHGRGPSIALSQQDWQMIGGNVATNSALGQKILSFCPEAAVDESAHQYEHSLEVQIPFLQEVQNRLSIVPLALSHLTFGLCEKLATALAQAIVDYNHPVLLLA
ncbi:MAG: AmmeMemoRadiSam system protein B, partial [Desulfopila sp.]|nr:AmmeMemoRadiSam system protein B [Desulfopila sp.]